MKDNSVSLEYLDSIRIDNYSNREPLPTEKSYNRLTPLFKVQGVGQWAFRCLCGKHCKATLTQVIRGVTTSCGCYATCKGNLQGVFRSLKLLNDAATITLTSIGTDYNKSRNWGFACKICGIEKLTCNPFEVLTQGRKFCKCSNRYQMDEGEVKTDVIEKIKHTTWINPVFPVSYQTKRDYRIGVTCSVCNHYVDMLYGNLVRGKGCNNCAGMRTSKRLLKDTDWFLNQANDVHSYKYDYSNVVYTKAREKVHIVCHEHGEPFHFWQSPDNHINKAKGCPECKRLRLRYVSFHRSRVEENKDIYLGIPSGVYLLQMRDSLFKIGISGVLDQRVSDIKRATKCPVEVIHYKAYNLYDSFHLEHYLHKKYSYCNHIDLKSSWAGHTECFILSSAEINDIILEINNYVR